LAEPSRCRVVASSRCRADCDTRADDAPAITGFDRTLHLSNPATDQQRPLRELPAFVQQPWQMSYGERSTIEGVLAMLKPTLAIEIGRAEGGSLRRIAAHSQEVVSFDIVEPPSELSSLGNVRALAGDSHAMLPAELARMAAEERNVDFVLVDGDHTTAGVRKDMHDLMESAAVGCTMILAHDTLNEEVRQGLEEIDYASYEKVAWVDLDFIPGYVARLPARLGECWGGLGLVVIDGSGAFRGGGPIHGTDLFEQHDLIWPTAQWIRQAGPEAAACISQLRLSGGPAAEADPSAQEQLAALTGELDRHRAWLRGIEGSASWRLTAPLRALKRRVRERLL
jgi:Methyltransferase domain